MEQEAKLVDLETKENHEMKDLDTQVLETIF